MNNNIYKEIRPARVDLWVRSRLEDRQRDTPKYRSIEHEVALWVDATDNAWSEVYAQLSEYWRKDRKKYDPDALLAAFNLVLNRVQHMDEWPEHISAQDIIDRLDDMIRRGERLGTVEIEDDIR